MSTEICTQDSKIHSKMGKMAILLQVWIDKTTNVLQPLRIETRQNAHGMQEVLKHSYLQFQNSGPSGAGLPIQKNNIKPHKLFTAARKTKTHALVSAVSGTNKGSSLAGEPPQKEIFDVPKLKRNMFGQYRTPND